MSAGGAVQDAIGVAEREMGDPQLALWLARLLQPDLIPGLLEAQLQGACIAEVEHCAASLCQP